MFSFIPFSGDAFSGASSLKLIYDSNVLIDAIRAFGGIASILPTTSSEEPILFFGPKNSFDFINNAEYTISFTASSRKNTPSFISKIEIYLVGPAFPIVNSRGLLIGTLEDKEDVLYTTFERQEFNVTALASGQAYLRFVIYGGQWHISNVSIIPAVEFGFTPDEVNVLIPIEGIKHQHLNFQTEFYDVNNNLFPVTASSTAFFDGGNTVLRGNQNRIDGELIVAPSGNVGVTLTTRGFTDINGIFQSGSTAIYIGSGTAGNANTPFLVGSGSSGPILSIGDRLIARQTGSDFTVTVSGTLLVDSGNTGTFVDVRNLITSASGISALYVIESTTFALNSASLMDNYSGSIYTASLQAASASLAQYAVNASASLAARDIAFSASQVQYTEERVVVDLTNKIKLPTSAKSVNGLYLETGSIGFYNVIQSNYPVVINDGGQFRFADSSSYIGGNDPYQRVIGFANGAFMIRTNKMFLSTPGFYLIGSDVSSSSANVIKMGSNAQNINFVSGAGFYADGTGSFRIGTDTTGSEYFSYSPSVGLIAKAKRLLLDAGGVYLTGDSNSSDSSATLKLGSNALGITSTSGSGFYVDGAGNFRAGKSVGAGDYILFSANNALFISSSNFFLQAGTSPVLQLNSYQLVLGSKIPSNWPFPQNDSGFSGSYINKDGQIFFGKANGNYIQFGGQVIEMKSSAFVLDSPGILLQSGSGIQNSGSFAVGNAPSTMTLTTGTGVFLGGTGTFRAGNPSGNQIIFDGTTFSITGSINVQGGNAATQGYAILTAGNAQTSASNSLTSFSSSNATQNVSISGSTASSLQTLSSSVAAGDAIRPNGGLRFATSPAGSGLFLGSDFMGYYTGGDWTTYIQNNGSFAFTGDATNYIAWDGSTLDVRANNFRLTGSGLFLDTTQATKVIRVGLASDLTTGTGVYMDSAGQFRAGGSSEFIKWDGSSLDISGSFFASSLFVGNKARATSFWAFNTTTFLTSVHAGYGLVFNTSQENHESLTGDGWFSNPLIWSSGSGLYLQPAGSHVFGGNPPDTVYKRLWLDQGVYNDYPIPSVHISTGTPSGPTSHSYGDIWVQIA